MAPDAAAVLRFWFGEARPFEPRPEWFRKDPDFDRDIARRFGPLIQEALLGGLVTWGAQAESALARVIVLDQFARNVFRGSARAFSGDALALPAARAMLAAGHDLALDPVQRVFVYLPLEHAEDLTAQDESVRLFAELEEETGSAQGWLDYARRHREVIARFGRFPHRNDVLGRLSTPEERAFLRQPGSSF